MLRLLIKLTTTKDIGDDTAESMASLLAMAVGNDSTKSITIIDNKRQHII